jgi:hypothetical protein
MNATAVRHITAIASDARSALHRCTIPIRALIEQGSATGTVVPRPAHDLDIPPKSVLVLQDGMTLAAADVKAAKHERCRFVHDVSDPHWLAASEDPEAPARAQIDRQLHSADTLTVATAALAEILHARGHQAIVLPDVVDERDWNVQPRRAEHRRPRLGWYLQHPLREPDWMLVEPVVRTLIDEVDFVFLGGVPAVLSDIGPRLERCAAVPFALFPALLAALDFDLVLAPLTANAFNARRSNLALLHAGMLAYPVLASDVEPHRGLPVARLPNAPGAWVTAVRERLHATDELRAEGETLRRAVFAGFLAPVWAQRYHSAWTTGTGAVAIG